MIYQAAPHQASIWITAGVQAALQRQRPVLSTTSTSYYHAENENKLIKRVSLQDVNVQNK